MDILEKMKALEEATEHQHMMTFFSDGSGFLRDTINWKRKEFDTPQHAREIMGREVFMINSLKFNNYG